MKKTPLKYILMIIFSVPILLLAISVIGRVAINHSFVKAYDDSVYKTESESKLLYLNFPESFIPYYNLGNVSYERKEYQAAVGYYKKALTLYPDANRFLRSRYSGKDRYGYFCPEHGKRYPS